MKEKKEISPPVLARKLLLTFLRSDLAEEVQGDLDEKFGRMCKQSSPVMARLGYWYQVLHYIRPFAIRKPRRGYSNHYTMFRNHFTIGWRSMLRQRMYSAIKAGGLSIGVAACILIGLFIIDELSFDQHIPDKERIFRVVDVWDDGQESGASVSFQAPFARALKDDYPEIELAGRFNPHHSFGAGSSEIRRADQPDNTHEEGFTFADQEMLDIMQFPFVHGNPKHALDQPHTLVISRSKAEKYFPGENPVGKQMVINNNDKEPFTIGGVIEDLPTNSSLPYDFFMTLKEVAFWEGEQTYWGATNYPTYIKVRVGTDVAALEKKLQKVISKYMLPHWIKEGRSDAEKLASYEYFKLQPVTDIHLYNGTTDDDLAHGDIRFVWQFGAVGIFILLLAVINFVNLSTARSANRAKEVGLRKTVGSMRSNIITQFLTESILFSFISFVPGVILAALFLPYFNALAMKTIDFPWSNWEIYPLLVGAAILVGLIAGIYPAFYLSSFRPALVMKGKLSLGNKSATMRSALVVFQFTSSIVLIISTVIVYRQMSFILDSKLGFDKDQVILLQGTQTLGNSVKPFKQELLGISSVQHATISDYLPVNGMKRNGNSFWNEGRQKIDPSIGAQVWTGDHDYIETLGLHLIAGRNFSKEIASDSTAMIVNESMAKALGLQDPLGKRVENWQKYTIIGVVEDFHFQSMRQPIRPLSIVLGFSPSVVAVKVKASDMAGTLKSVGEVWKKFSPHQPIRYVFLDEQFVRMYDDVQRMGKVFTTFAILTIIVACLGLFALSAYMVEQRNKEISVRLVLGASMKNILSLLSGSFVKLIVVALLIAAPLAWYLMTQWLQGFAYKTKITLDIFLLSGVVAIVIALATISYHTIRAALANPAQGLKSE